MKHVLLLTLLLAATACSMTVPVAVVNKHGGVMKGSATASMSGGTFQVADDKVSCSGTYDAMSMAATISMPVTCSDGRSGTVTATRDDTMMSGSGYVDLSDKSHAAFFFGNAAEEFLSKQAQVGGL
jgi:hypothetical protein